MEAYGHMNIKEYLEFVRTTDRLPAEDLSAVLHGLFGEVGGIMAAAKKLKREPGSFTGFNQVVIEEFGDAFWYLCCLASRIDVSISEVIRNLATETTIEPELIIASGKSHVSLAYVPELNDDFDDALVKLGGLTGEFLSTEFILENPAEKVRLFLQAFFQLVAMLEIDFGEVVNYNIQKTSGRFIRPNNSDLPVFDESYPDFEQLPEEFEIQFVQRTDRQQAMMLNGVFIGDPLTDSIVDVDGYRFHDVFHFSHAAILHWSPTFRSLLKRKRKSNPEVDEGQDGGRAIVVEEGLTAWIFAIAKENQFFSNNRNLTFDLLKNIGHFVTGFEVDQCPLILWEEAVLKGYEVFREVKKNNGGIIVGSKLDRTIEYRSK